jgi:branched-subunit amino acid transport protein
MTWLLALALASAGTYSLRLGSTRLVGERGLPSAAERMLRFAAVGLMSTLVISNLPDEGIRGLSLATVCGLTAGVVTARLRPNTTLVTLVAVVTYGTVGVLIG